MTKDASKDEAAATLSEKLDFTPNGILSRIRGTLTGWITTLTALATVIFAGVSLSEYVKAPVTASATVVSTAQFSLFMLALGIALMVGSAGWASALRAAPQDGAFRSPVRDSLRFFPAATAPALLKEYENELTRFKAARLQNDMPAMKEALFWADAHSGRLWAWLEAYRTREAAHEFQKASAVIGFGTLLTIAGVIGFADALRLMKSPLPVDVIIQGPKNGTMSLLVRGGIAAGGVDPGLEACMTKVKNGELIVPVTVMSVKTPTAEQKTAGVNYVASVVPPMTMIQGCVVKVYDITSKQAEVLVAAEAPEEAPVAAVVATTAATK